MEQIGLAILEYAARPIKWLAGKMGVTDRPHFVFGGVSANLQDRRPSYRSLYHLGCVNQQRPGWITSHIRTRDANDCRVCLRFRLASGEWPAIEDEGIITTGATSDVVATLFVGKPVAIPLYWSADGNQPHPLRPSGEVLPTGYYVAGAEFLFHGEVRRSWRLTQGIYLVTVTVIWDRQPFEYEFELPVLS
jgi:hypothetical protein